MKIFDNINKGGKCVICGENTDGKVTLIPVDGTEEESIVQCEQVHIACLDLRMKKKYLENDSIIYQLFEETK